MKTGSTRVVTKGTSYPGPVGIGARERESTRDQFFCNQARTYLCKPAASITIDLFVNLGMIGDSDYHANKLYEFRRGSEKLRGPSIGLRTPL